MANEQMECPGAYVFDVNNGLTELGTLGGWGSYGMKINDSGQAVGWSHDSSAYENGYIFEEGSMTNIGTVYGNNCVPLGLNNNGDVVGGCYIEWEIRQAFVYDEETGIENLNDLIDPSSGWLLNNSRDINDSGMIVGYGTNDIGERHGFLLKPVPEPGTMCLIGLGGVAMLRRRK